MKRRSLVEMVVLSILSVGIYPIIWLVLTKNEMNRSGADIPTALWWFIPFGGFWWLYCYCKGVQLVTRDRIHMALALVVLCCLPTMIIPMLVLQDQFNAVAAEPPIPPAHAQLA